MNSDYELDFVSVKGFKSIDSIDSFGIAPINILIGANGAGKSNFINIFTFMHEVREGRLQNFVRRAGGADQLLHFGSKTTETMEFYFSFKKGINSYRLKLTYDANDTLFPSEEVASYWDKRYPRPYDNYLSSMPNGPEAGISNPDLKGSADWVRHRLGRWLVYHLHDTSSTSPMRKTAIVADNSFLRFDASNLPAFLYRLKLTHVDSYNLIVSTVRRVAPFLRDFTLNPDQINPETIRLSWRHTNSDKYFSSSSLSDGSLRFIALATLLLQPEDLRPKVILLDEPELGLHPLAINLLASMMHSASSTSQVIASTQSALLLDYFNPSDIVVAERNQEATVLRRLQDNELVEWLTDYSLGQLWEKNMLGGRPR